MLGDMINRIQGAKVEAQERLKAVSVEKSDANNQVTVTMSGEKRILDLKIAPELHEKGEPELTADVVANVINEALVEVAVKEKEIMDKISADIMPGGLEGFKGLLG